MKPAPLFFSIFLSLHLFVLCHSETRVTGDHSEALMKILETTTPKEVRDGVLKKGGVLRQQFTLGAGEKMVIAILWEGTASFPVTLKSPDGKVLAEDKGHLEGVEFISDEHAEAFLLTGAIPGAWEFSVEAKKAAKEGTSYALLLMSDSIKQKSSTAQAPQEGWRLESFISPKEVNIQENVQVNVRLGTGIPHSADVTVQIPENLESLPSRISLYDDGKHGDLKAGDGVYGDAFSFGTPGNKGVRFEAVWQDAGGRWMRASSTDSFRVVLRPTQTILIKSLSNERAYRSAVKFEHLDVDAVIYFSREGPFHLMANLYAPDGTEVAHSESCVIEGPAGQDVRVTLRFRGEDIYSKHKDGPFTVKGLFLQKESSGTDRIFDQKIELKTKPYKANDFVFRDRDGDDLPDEVEAKLGTDPTMKDTDGDGLTDYEEVSRDGDPSNYTPGVDTNPLNPDTDGDGRIDGLDDFPLDSARQDATTPVDSYFMQEAANPAGADVYLTTPALSIPGHRPLTYSWSWVGGSAMGSTSTLHFPLGISTVTLTVMDDHILFSSATAIVTVTDTKPPTIINKCEVLNSTDNIYRINWAARDAVDPLPITTGVVLAPLLDGFQAVLVSSSVTTMTIDASQRKVWFAAPNPAEFQASVTHAGGFSVTKGQTARVLPATRQSLFTYALRSNVLIVQASSPLLKLTAKDSSGNESTITIAAPWK